MVVAKGLTVAADTVAVHLMEVADTVVAALLTAAADMVAVENRPAVADTVVVAVATDTINQY
jgi:hypothetical protein